MNKKTEDIHSISDSRAREVRDRSISRVVRHMERMEAAKRMNNDEEAASSANAALRCAQRAVLMGEILESRGVSQYDDVIRSRKKSIAQNLLERFRS